MPEGTRATLRLFASILGHIAGELRATGDAWEYCWVVEQSEVGVPHVHFLQHGATVAAPKFREAAKRAGAFGDLQKIRHPARLVRYCFKLPMLGVDVPEADAAAAMSLSLALNGGALCHSSRRFWRDENGDPLPGLRAARVTARANRSGRPAPRADQLSVWRSGWKLPPVSGILAANAVDALGPETAPGQGEAQGAGLSDVP